jgi:hypothetical protein
MDLPAEAGSHISLSLSHTASTERRLRVPVDVQGMALSHSGRQRVFEKNYRLQDIQLSKTPESAQPTAATFQYNSFVARRPVRLRYSYGGHPFTRLANRSSRARW